MELEDRARGSMLGLAVGDCLGAAVEFLAPGTFEPVTTIRSGGSHGLCAGQWTDDTSLALCLGESLVACRGFDPADQLARYLRWLRHGHNSSIGKCFGIGRATYLALERFERERSLRCTDLHSAGNGSLMRLAPVPLYFHREPELALERAGESSLTTHGAPEAADACRYFSSLLVGALEGRTKPELLDSARAPAQLHPRVRAVAEGSFLRREPPAIRAHGYCVATLEAALWAFARHDDFAAGALAAVNLGEDSDTVGAVYGQLAGAHYGLDAIPSAWRALIHRRADIEDLAVALVQGPPATAKSPSAGRPKGFQENSTAP
jgi:ADP-ribosylglycohydrolase